MVDAASLRIQLRQGVDLRNRLVDAQPLKLLMGSRMLIWICAATILGRWHLFQNDALRSVRTTVDRRPLLIGKPWAFPLFTIILYLLLIFVLLFQACFLRSRRLRPASIEIDIREKVLGNVDPSPYFDLFHVWQENRRWVCVIKARLFELND